MVSQSCLAARLSFSNFPHFLLSDIKVFLPSFGSGNPLTKPASCREETMELIDCGRTPSARAKLETVSAPSFSRRRRTEIWDGVRSCCPPCSRKRRFSVLSMARSCAARSDAAWDSGASGRLLIVEAYHLHSLPVQIDCIIVVICSRLMYEHKRWHRSGYVAYPAQETRTLFSST